MPDADESMTDAPATVLFRPSKKRNAQSYRQRATDSEAQSSHPATVDATASGPTLPAVPGDTRLGLVAEAAERDGDGDEGDHVVRARNARRARVHGVAFRAGTPASATATPPPVVAEASTEMVLHDGGATAGEAAALAVPNRFTTATGLTTELNTKHMMEYIESGLARRHNRQPQPAATTITTTATANPPNPARAVTESQPAAIRGRILEVDLGDEVRSRNVEMTERAARRLQPDPSTDQDDSGSDRKQPGAMRIGRDSKARSGAGGRNRRGSDDIKRDKFVEEFLHENRLDVYDHNPATGVVQSSGGNYFDSAELDLFNNPDDADLPDDGAAADDRIAEQFRREFMEALHERQQLRRRKRKAASNAPPAPRPGAGPPPGAGGPVRPGKKNDGEILRGPRLGGSRNDRAQMRDLLLASQKEKKPALSGPAGRRR